MYQVTRTTTDKLEETLNDAGAAVDVGGFVLTPDVCFEWVGGRDWIVIAYVAEPSVVAPTAAPSGAYAAMAKLREQLNAEAADAVTSHDADATTRAEHLIAMAMSIYGPLPATD